MYYTCIHQHSHIPHPTTHNVITHRHLHTHIHLHTHHHTHTHTHQSLSHTHTPPNFILFLNACGHINPPPPHTHTKHTPTRPPPPTDVAAGSTPPPNHTPSPSHPSVYFRVSGEGSTEEAHFESGFKRCNRCRETDLYWNRVPHTRHPILERPFTGTRGVCYHTQPQHGSMS